MNRKILGEPAPTIYMVLDLIERSHPDYEGKMAEALTSALADMGQSPGMTSEEFNDWLTKVFEWK